MTRVICGVGLCALVVSACGPKIELSTNGTDGSGDGSDVSTLGTSPPAMTTTSAGTQRTTDTTDTIDTIDTTATVTGPTPTSTGPGETGNCFPSCQDSEECCEIYMLDPATCADTFGGYTCNDQMYCVAVGCSSDRECADLLQNESWACNARSEFCEFRCEADADCEAAFPTLGFTCQDTVCTPPEPEPCGSNFECEPLFCDTSTGSCVECFEDPDCADSPFGRRCDPRTNFCACTDDSECAFKGDVCR